MPASVRKQIARYLASRATGDSDLAGAELIVGELLANSVRHAPGSLQLTLTWQDDYALLRLSDTGPGFRYPVPPGDPRAEGGRGLRLIAALARELRVFCESGLGTTIEVVLPVRRRD